METRCVRLCLVLWIVAMLVSGLVAAPPRDKKSGKPPPKPGPATTSTEPDPTPTPPTNEEPIHDPGPSTSAGPPPILTSALSYPVPNYMAQLIQRQEMEKKAREHSVQYDRRCQELESTIPSHLPEAERRAMIASLIEADPTASYYLRLTGDDLCRLCPLWRTVTAGTLPTIISAVTGPRAFSPPADRPPPPPLDIRTLVTSHPVPAVHEILRRHFLRYFADETRIEAPNVPSELWRGDPFLNVINSVGHWMLAGHGVSLGMVFERFGMVPGPSRHPVHITILPTPEECPVSGYVAYMATLTQLIISAPMATMDLATTSMWIRAFEELVPNAPNRPSVDQIIAAVRPMEYNPDTDRAQHPSTTTSASATAVTVSTGAAEGRTDHEDQRMDADDGSTSEVLPVSPSRLLVPPAVPRLVLPGGPTMRTRSATEGSQVPESPTATTSHNARCHSADPMPADLLELGDAFNRPLTPLDFDDEIEKIIFGEDIDVGQGEEESLIATDTTFDHSYDSLGTTSVTISSESDTDVQDEEPEPASRARRSQPVREPEPSGAIEVEPVEDEESSEGAFEIVEEADDDDEVFEAAGPSVPARASTATPVLGPPPFPRVHQLESICMGANLWCKNEKLKPLEGPPNRPWHRLNLDCHTEGQCNAVWRRHGEAFQAAMTRWLAPNNTRENLESPVEVARALAGQILRIASDDRTPTQISREWYTMYGDVWTPPIVRQSPGQDHLPLLFALVWMQLGRHGTRTTYGPDDALVRMVLGAQARRVCPQPTLAGTQDAYDRLQASNPAEARHILYHAMTRRFGPTVDIDGQVTDDRYFVEGPSSGLVDGGRETIRIPLIAHPLSPMEPAFPLTADDEPWEFMFTRYAFLRFAYLSVIGPPAVRLVSSLAAIAMRHSTRTTVTSLVAWWRFVHEASRGSLSAREMDAGWCLDGRGVQSDHRPGFYALFSTFGHWLQQNPALFIRLVPRIPFQATWTANDLFGIPSRLFSRAMSYATQEALRNPSALLRGAVRLLGSTWNPAEPMDEPGEDTSQWPRILRDWVGPLEAIHHKKTHPTAWSFGTRRAYSRSTSVDWLVTPIRNWIKLADRSPPITPVDPDMPTSSSAAAEREHREAVAAMMDEEEDATPGRDLQPGRDTTDSDNDETSEEEEQPRRRRRPRNGKGPPRSAAEPPTKRRRK